MKQNKRKHRKLRKPVKFVLAVIALCLVSAGGTIAWITAKSGTVNNQFSIASTTVEVNEDFDGKVKKNVTVENTGDVPVYVRIKLVTYRVNDEGDHIGGTAKIPEFSAGEGWVEKDGFYYYKHPVESGSTPINPLIGNDGIQLVSYTDVDGGKQAIEVMAEGIQSSPADAVISAWGVGVDDNGNLTQNPATNEGGTQQ